MCETRQKIIDIEVKITALRVEQNLLRQARRQEFAGRLEQSLTRQSKLRKAYEGFTFDRIALPDYADFVRCVMDWLGIKEFTSETADQMAVALGTRWAEFDDYMDPPE